MFPRKEGLPNGKLRRSDTIQSTPCQQVWQAECAIPQLRAEGASRRSEILRGMGGGSVLGVRERPRQGRGFVPPKRSFGTPHDEGVLCEQPLGAPAVSIGRGSFAPCDES